MREETEISYAYYPCPFGLLKIGCVQGAVVFLRIVSAPDSPDRPTSLSDLANRQLEEYFSGRRTAFSLPVRPEGTSFRLRIWEELCRIPYGQTRSYAQIARSIGNPNAARAVGMANRSNPIWILIPCHRVIASNGDLTGYAGGLEMKRALLTLETGNRPQ